MSAFATRLPHWLSLFESGKLDAQLVTCYGAAAATWRGRYRTILQSFSNCFGDDGDLVIARCPAQMNIMGMHLDYGGMPSLRLAVQGADTITVARSARGRMRLRSFLGDSMVERFASAEFALQEFLPTENVGTPRSIHDYAARVCREREANTGGANADDWHILPRCGLIFLESYFRDRKKIDGIDACIWSNISPEGGMSSSSALLVSTAYAAMAAHGLRPEEDIPVADLVDGLGSSEWIRGTRGGTADHGGMIMAKVGCLTSVGVFPSRVHGRVALQDEYRAITLETGVPRTYDEVAKEETCASYPVGLFIARELVLPRRQQESLFSRLTSEYRDRLEWIGDLTEKNLGLTLSGIYELLRSLPTEITLEELETWATESGATVAFGRLRAELAVKFALVDSQLPLRVRRRCAFALAEQDRVGRMLEAISMEKADQALDFIRTSHDGEQDTEVTDDELLELRNAAAAGSEQAGLCYLPGGYGRMTKEYDRVVRSINRYLLDHGGERGGAVQRLGAGWGGNVGGLVHRSFVEGEEQAAFRMFLREELGTQNDPIVVCLPGEGAGPIIPANDV